MPDNMDTAGDAILRVEEGSEELFAPVLRSLALCETLPEGVAHVALTETLDPDPPE